MATPEGLNLQPAAPVSGQATVVPIAVPSGSMEYWVERFGAEGVDFNGPFQRFGKQVIFFQDSDRLDLELVMDERVNSVPAWNESTVPQDSGIRGFWSTTMKLLDTEATGGLLTKVLGFEKTGEEGSLSLYQTGNAVGGSVILEKVKLGKVLFLPSWLESSREMIEKRLPDIRI